MMWNGWREYKNGSSSSSSINIFLFSSVRLRLASPCLCNNSSRRSVGRSSWMCTEEGEEDDDEDARLERLRQSITVRCSSSSFSYYPHSFPSPLLCFCCCGGGSSPYFYFFFYFCLLCVTVWHIRTNERHTHTQMHTKREKRRSRRDGGADGGGNQTSSGRITLHCTAYPHTLYDVCSL